MSTTKTKRSTKSSVVPVAEPVVAQVVAPVVNTKPVRKTKGSVVAPTPVVEPVLVTAPTPVVESTAPKPKRKAKASPVVETAPVVENKKTKSTTLVNDEVDTTNDSRKRYFRCIYVKDNKVVEGGCYCGKKPKQAGNKACTKVCNDLFSDKKSASQKVTFGMYEVRFKKTDANKSKPRKLYVYDGERIKLDTPAEVPIHLTGTNSSEKQPKLDPTTKTQMVIRYNHYNKIKKCVNTTSELYNSLTNWIATNMNGDRVKSEEVKEPKKPRKTKTVSPVVEPAPVVEPIKVEPVKVAEPVETPAPKKAPRTKKAVSTTVVLDAPPVTVTKTATPAVEPKKTRTKKV